MKLTFLPSDILLYILLLAIALYLFWLKRNPHLRSPWVKVLKNPWGISALTILLVYFTVGVADSIHYQKRLPGAAAIEAQYSPVVISLLDNFLWPLGEDTEKTYSAPLATTLYVKELMETDSGTLERDYPPLKYAALAVNEGKISYEKDLTSRSIKAFGIAITLWLIVSMLLITGLRLKEKSSYGTIFKKVLKNQYPLCYWSFLLTLFFIFLIFSVIHQFAFQYHLLGTDKVGNDVFYETVKSIRTGLLIGSLTTLITLPFALFFGTMAGYFGGLVDDIIQYLYTTLSAIPGVLLIAAAILSIQIYIDNHANYFTSTASMADARLIALCSILGITSWTGFCRVIRGETLKLRELDFIHAAKALGTGWHKILMKHIFPNILHIVIITVVLDFSVLVLAEAVLTYVGVGVDPTMLSWGNMIDGARLELARDPTVWWPLLAAFTGMFIFVLAANLFADAVQEAFDPRS